jgi:NTE family protein
MVTAFVMSGGGSLGAVQVGMLQALTARGVAPDLLLGTSAGALNAVHVAGHGVSDASLDDLEAIWSGLRRRDVFPLQPARLAAAALGRAPSLCPDDALRHLVREHVAVFPSVRIAGRDLVDGGVADNTAVSQAVALGADIVYVLPTGYACALDRPPTTPLASALQALTLLIEQRPILEVGHFAHHADIRVLPPLCPLSVSSADFRHGARLVARSRAATGRWLDEGGPRLAHPERFLSLHRHTLTGNPVAAPCHGGQAA